MGQVLGFSHCKEFGSVSSTPDSTPPCTDGGNEESDFPELQTAREWSEEEDGFDDEEGGTSSPSVWGTPRQNSFELTFSYIAFSEPDLGGAPRRDSTGSRRRAGGRGGRPALARADTVEAPLPLDSPEVEVEWDPHSLPCEEGERDRGGQEEIEKGCETEERQGEMPHPPSSLELRIQHPLHFTPMEVKCESLQVQDRQKVESSDPQQYDLPDSYQVLCTGESSLVVMETTDTLDVVEQAEGGIADVTSSAPYSFIGQNTQEEPVSERWCSTLSLSEGTTQWIQIEVMDLIYWRDMERTGVVFTGLVVGLLSLFQLSIITVVSTLSLAIMCFTITVYVYYKVLHALKWGDGVHPFQSYLDCDISLSGEKAEHYMQRTIVLTLSTIMAMKRLLFVANLVNSLKALAVAYLLTFVGAVFNGLTLVIIGVISVFSLPLFYKQRQVEIDKFLAIVMAHIDNMKDIFHRLCQGGGPAPDPDPAPGGAKPKIK